MGIAIATVLSASSLATAADYYFDSVGGSDTADGKTEGTAKQTLKMPTGTGNTVYLKRGSSWTMSLTANNVTVKAYGSGDRPAFIGTISLTNSTVEGVAAKPPAGGTKAINGINVNGGSTLSDCEVDGGGRADFMINVGIGVMGTNNKILNNYIHDLNWSASGGQMDNSGGAEAIMVMGSNNEVAFNTGVNCQSANSTLGGFEGGCWEIVNGKAKSTISNVSFHHNYCEKSIGMWEASSGDFSASGGNIQDPANHGIVENVTVSYNVAVDSMWMFLLQPVNTDFKNLVFANNTIIHTPNTMVWFDASHTSMGLDVHTYTNTAVGDGGTTFDTDTPYYKKGAGFQPGTVIVKNNVFVDNISPTRQYMMFSTNLTDHFNNIFVPAKAQVGSFTLGATEQKIDLGSLAFTSDYRLTSASTPAIDKGVVVDMTTNNSVATSAVDPTIFASVFNQDIDKHQVPCGAGVDIGASEYCEGAGGSSGTGGVTAAKGTGGATSPGGAAGTVTGGATSSGGAKGSGGMASAGGTQGSGGASSSVGATTTSSGGTSGAGGAMSSGAANGTGGATGGQKSATGCSCELGQGSSSGPGGCLAALLLGMLAVTVRRRRSS
jgi:MYXO-CTERM domain-containing protein